MALHSLGTLLAASELDIERRVTGIDGDPHKNTALRPRVGCSRYTDGTVHKSDAS